jgi:GntR family transcriptional regulator
MDQAVELRRDDAVPLYHQIFLALRDEIVGGRRPYGSIVPTEHDLADRFAVSRITARRALDELAGQGLVERKRRIGTRVIFHAAPAHIDANIDQAVESLLAFGRDTKVRVLDLDEVAADDFVADALGILPGTRVLRAIRIRLRGGEPIGQVVSYTATSFAGVLTRRALTRAPLLELLLGSGARIGAGQQTVAAVAADPALAEALQLEARAPLLRVERHVHDDAGKPLLLTIAHYRGDRYRLAIDLHGRPKASLA